VKFHGRLEPNSWGRFGGRQVCENQTVTGVTRTDSGAWQLELRVRDGGHYWYCRAPSALLVCSIGCQSLGNPNPDPPALNPNAGTG